jgi:hypothetical protein
VRSQLQQQGYSIMRHYADFNSLVVSGGNIAAAATASVGSSSSSTTGTDAVAAEISAQLAAMRGVGHVEAGGMRHLFPQPSAGMIIAPPSLSPPAGSTEGNATAEEAVCSEADGKLGPDADLGRRGEGVPYGVKLVQADDPAMVVVARKFRSKVLFCVIDTGLDRTNKEFNNASEWEATLRGWQALEAAPLLSMLAVNVAAACCSLPAVFAINSCATAVAILVS